MPALNISPAFLPLLAEAARSQRARDALRTKERRIASIQRRLAREYAGIFLEQQKTFLSEFTRLRPLFPREGQVSETVLPNNIDPALLAASEATEAAAVEAVNNAIEAAVFAGADVLLKDLGGVSLGLSLDIIDPQVIATLQQVAAQQVTGIDESTRRTMRNIITRAAREGWSWQQTANEIIDRYESFRFRMGGPLHFNNRAELIAVTEIGNAYEEGARLGAKALQNEGIPMQKRWSGPNDERTSTACRQNLAAGWIDIDETFPSGDMRPLNHPGCRHTALYRRKRF